MIDGFVLDRTDAALGGAIEALGMKVHVTDTMMRDDTDKQRSAAETRDFVDGLARSLQHS